MQKKSAYEQICITGGAGFIGANVVKYLLDTGGYKLVVYDNLSACSIKNLKKAVRDSRQRGSVRYVAGDILNARCLSKAVKGCSAVVHLAAHTRVVDSLKNPQVNFHTNCVGIFNVLEAVRRHAVTKFVFASSNAAVGEQIPPIHERMVPKPLSPYGASKLFGEALCSAYFHSYGIKTVALRFANAYGPYSAHKPSVVAQFIKKVKEKKEIIIFGDGKQTRDFIHARDIAQAISLCLRMPVSNSTIWGEVFQIARGKETTINGLAHMIQSCACHRGYRKKKKKFKASRKGEIRKNYSTITKARRLLSFSPAIDLEAGIPDLLT